MLQTVGQGSLEAGCSKHHCHHGMRIMAARHCGRPSEPCEADRHARPAPLGGWGFKISRGAPGGRADRKHTRVMWIVSRWAGRAADSEAAAGSGCRVTGRPYTDKGDLGRGVGCRSGSGGGRCRVRSAREGGDAGRRAADERAGRLGAMSGR
jgi:hypothetical protein